MWDGLYNKRKCIRCIYHGTGAGYYTQGRRERIMVHCNYAHSTTGTCLTRGEHGEVIDRRGGDYNNCLLFSEGKARKTGLEEI